MTKYLDYVDTAKNWGLQICTSISETVALVFDKFEVEESDVQIKILYALLAWLGINILLILLAWRYLGERVVKMLTPNG